MAEIFSKKLFDDLGSLHGKSDQANAALREIRDILKASLPVKFPAPVPDACLPIVTDLSKRLGELEGKLNDFGLLLEAINEKLGQFVVLT